MKLYINNIGPLHPYRWRHGGASMDFWEKHRDLVSIQKRGRWRAMASVRRYEKGGRLAQLLSKLPDTTQELATWASENIDEGYYNQPAPATAHSLTTPCFLELFSGSDHHSKAVHHIISWNYITWNILHGSEYDLRSSAKRKQILNWIKSGMVQAVHLGIP